MLAILEEIQKLTDTEKELTEKIQIYKDNDPEVLQKMKEDIKVSCSFAKAKLAFPDIWTTLMKFYVDRF